jgi:hypothetical protein
MASTWVKSIRWMEQRHNGYWCVHEIVFGRTMAWSHLPEETMNYAPHDGEHHTVLEANNRESAVSLLRAFDGRTFQGA